jgi:hypothetical protein
VGWLLLIGSTAGCGTTGGRNWWCIDNCATIPKGAISGPYGSHLNCILAGQQDRAQVEKLTIYKHEWYLDGTEPGPAGRRHLATIARMLECVPPDWPVVVEPVVPEEEKVVSFDAANKLNEERRLRVVEILAEQGHPDANERVILGYPTAEGLYGDPGALIGGRYMFTQGGMGAGRGGFGGGGFGGGGLGGVGVGGIGGIGNVGGMGVGGFY